MPNRSVASAVLLAFLVISRLRVSAAAEIRKPDFLVFADARVLVSNAG
ncbi:MAG TPA: hypothetical protein VK673_15775 [Chthoniobacterales bacterium]|nr:hypothetical protein [Chthoniobacterales bacterium]